MSGESWRDWAACADVDPELFFPVAVSGPVFEAQVASAKAVCGTCPVRDQCLAWAVRSQPYGVAGGLAEHERRGLAAGAKPRVSGSRPVGATRREMAAAGRAAVRAGTPVDEIAREFGVPRDTAARWARQVRAEAGRGQAA